MEDKILQEEEKEFKRYFGLSLWWINNKPLIKKIGYGFFIAFDAALLLFVIWTALDTYLISYGTEKRAVAEMIVLGQAEIAAFTQSNAAAPLQEGAASVLSLGGEKYDFYASLTNPNIQWYATFDYSFNSTIGGTEEKKGFILPNEEKPLIEFAVESLIPPRSAELQIDNIEWHRVDPHMVQDYDIWLSERLDIEIKDVNFVTSVEVDEQTLGRVEFTIENNSAYSYFDPSFIILLKSGSKVVGVNRTTLSSLDTGQSRKVEVNWFGPLPSVSKVEVVPEINIFDENTYKPL